MKQAVGLVRKPVPKPAVLVPPTLFNRTTLMSAGLAVLLAVVFWACDGFLLVQLRAMANEAYTNSPSNPVLRVDDVDALNAYSPRRLSQCLWLPSVQVRTAVCQAIGRRPTWTDSESWVGVLPALLKVHRESDDRDFQATVAHALMNMNSVPPEDVSEVFTFADEQLTAKEPKWILCAHLLNITADSLPDHRSDVLQTFERSLAVPVAQSETTRRLARLAPTSSEAAAAVRASTRSYAPSGFAGTPEVREIVLRQPSLIDELLDGTTNQQLAALAIASGDLVKAPTLLKKDVPESRRPTWLTWERLQRMRTCALELCGRTTELDRVENPEPLFNFLSFWWDGPEALFDLAKSSSGKRRSLALRSSIRGANRRTKSGAQQFLNSNLPDMLAWLGENDAATKRAVLDVLSTYFDPQWSRLQSRETNGMVVDACRKMLDQFPGDNDFPCVSLMLNIRNEIDETDADRIAAALERALLVLQRGYERTSHKPQGTIHEVHRRLFDRIARHETRPAVASAVKLRRNLEAEGIVDVRMVPRSVAVPSNN